MTESKRSSNFSKHKGSRLKTTSGQSSAKASLAQSSDNSISKKVNSKNSSTTGNSKRQPSKVKHKPIRFITLKRVLEAVLVAIIVGLTGVAIMSISGCAVTHTTELCVTTDVMDKCFECHPGESEDDCMLRNDTLFLNYE